MNDTPEQADSDQTTSSASDDLQLFVSALSKMDGGKSGNKSLRDALGWADEQDRYWKAHGRALDQGLVVSGRGKGGSVQLVTAEESNSRADDEPQAPQGERALYDPAKDVIERSWAKSENYDEIIVEVTALRGSAATGGKWTRPDISILASKAYPYLPHRSFDIVTFEVKPENQVNVEGVFEALSHQQFASRSYCLFHVPDLAASESFHEKYKDAQRILSTARKHGIGIILSTDISDFETWDEILNAERVTPDPEQANRFIATSFSQDIRDKIIKWHK